MPKSIQKTHQKLNQQIHYIFSIGYHSRSIKVLKKYDLYRCSGPFDYMIIDLETCFANIKNAYSRFLDYNDLVMIQQSEKKIISYKHINDNIIQLVQKHENQPITFMNKNYFTEPLFMNQSYVHNNDQVIPLDSEIHHWDHVCIFNDNVFETTLRKALLKRCERFNRMYQIQPKHICLFHITLIIDMPLKAYKKYVEHLMKYYRINCFLTMIVCTIDPVKKKYELRNNILFIHKVISLDADNDYRFEKEINIMKQQLDIQLVSNEIIQNTYDYDQEIIV